MRTTVTIDDALLERAKRRASSRGQTLGDVVQDALHYFLSRPDPVAGPPLPVFHGGQGFARGVDPSSNASLLDAADDDRRA